MAEPRSSSKRSGRSSVRGERHDSLRDLVPSLVERAMRGAPDAHGARRPGILGGEGRSFEVGAGRSARHHRPERRRQVDHAEAADQDPAADRGPVEITGRVGALIEVAAGFHPDLTGRENVFLQGAIMGMRRAEIARKFDADRRLLRRRRFHRHAGQALLSGMNARLGFAIAAHLDPTC